MGYFVTGLVSDEPDPVAFLASSSSQQRAATRVESAADSEPAFRERVRVFGARRSVPEQEPTATRVSRFDQPWRWHHSETWLARP